MLNELSGGQTVVQFGRGIGFVPKEPTADWLTS